MSQKPEVSKEEFLAWLEDPVTQVLRRTAEATRRGLMEDWASGKFTDGTKEGTDQLNAESLGRCQVLAWLMHIEYTDLEVITDD